MNLRKNKHYNTNFLKERNLAFHIEKDPEHNAGRFVPCSGSFLDLKLKAYLSLTSNVYYFFINIHKKLYKIDKYIQ